MKQIRAGKFVMMVISAILLDDVDSVFKGYRGAHIVYKNRRELNLVRRYAKRIGITLEEC